MQIKVDDIVISGKLDHVKETLKRLEIPYYQSNSKGLVLIQDMDPYHLRNAIIKKSKDILDSFREEEPEVFSTRIISNGLNGGDNKELELLCRELVNRFVQRN